MSSDKMEIEAIAHWITLGWEDWESIHDLVRESMPRNPDEYAKYQDQWERRWRLGAAMDYLRNLEGEIEGLAK
jgi:hypothetical protein